MALSPEQRLATRADKVGNRLFKIRWITNFRGHGSQKKFAEKHEFEPGSWSQWEVGEVLIPVPMAAVLVFAVEGITTDYIYLGRLGGVPFDVRALLEAAPDRSCSS